MRILMRMLAIESKWVDEVAPSIRNFIDKRVPLKPKGKLI
jgi:hypothetical protein